MADIASIIALVGIGSEDSPSTLATASSALTFYDARLGEHMRLVKHLSAEQDAEEFLLVVGWYDAGSVCGGRITVLDALNYASVATYSCEVRLPADSVVEEPASST